MTSRPIARRPSYCLWSDSSEAFLENVSEAPISASPGAHVTEVGPDDPIVMHWDGRPDACMCAGLATVADMDAINRIAGILAMNPGCVFRGQSNATWDLRSNIERTDNLFVKREEGLERYEHMIMMAARQRLHNYLTELPKHEDWFSWSALIRHYGAPTRLLDVSNSIYVALFFALSEPGKRDAAVWIIDSNAAELNLNRWLQRVRPEHMRTSIEGRGVSIGTFEYRRPHHGEVDPGPPKFDVKHFRSVGQEFQDARKHFIDAAMCGYVEAPGAAILSPLGLALG